VTEENSFATDVVIRSYLRRNTSIRDIGPHRKETPTEKELRSQIFMWEKENTAALLESGNVDKAAAGHFLGILNDRIKNINKRSFFRRFLRVLKHVLSLRRKNGAMPNRADFVVIIESNTRYVLEKLNETKNTENAAAVEKFAAEFELMSVMSRGRNHARPGTLGDADNSAVHAVVTRAFSIERELIQEMFELGRITRETARGMRADIMTLETQLQADTQ
jgi:CPA1 family monovalent cation:H+ antiporter